MTQTANAPKLSRKYKLSAMVDQELYTAANTAAYDYGVPTSVLIATVIRDYLQKAGRLPKRAGQLTLLSVEKHADGS